MSAVRSSRYEWDTFFGPPVLLGEGVGSSRPWRGSNPSAQTAEEQRRLLEGFEARDLAQRSEHNVIANQRQENNDMRLAREQQQQQQRAAAAVLAPALPAAIAPASTSGNPRRNSGGAGAADADADVELLTVPSLLALHQPINQL